MRKVFMGDDIFDVRFRAVGTAAKDIMLEHAETVSKLAVIATEKETCPKHVFFSGYMAGIQDALLCVRYGKLDLKELTVEPAESD